MLVDMRLDIFFKVTPAFVSGVTCIFEFRFSAGRHIIDVVLNRRTSNQIVLQQLIASCGCHLRHKIVGADNICKGGLGNS